MWGFLAGLTWGFRQRRPWEGWWGAFTRACNVLALFFVAVAVVAVGLTFYDYYVREPEARERAKRIEECVQQYMVPVPVTYPNGPTMMYAPDAYARCGAP